MRDWERRNRRMERLHGECAAVCETRDHRCSNKNQMDKVLNYISTRILIKNGKVQKIVCVRECNILQGNNNWLESLAVGIDLSLKMYLVWEI